MSTKAERQAHQAFLDKHSRERAYAQLIAMRAHWLKVAEVAKDEAEREFCVREADSVNAKLRRREKHQS